MPQRDRKFGARHGAETIARVTGLSLNEIDTSVPIESVSTGMSFTIVPLKTLAALQCLRIDLHAGTEYLQKTAGKFFYFVSPETVNPPARLHSRILLSHLQHPPTPPPPAC